MSASGGVDIGQLAKNSLLRVRTDFYFAPEATDVDKFVASIDPSSAATVGTALTLTSATDGFMLRFPRRPTLVLTDASGGSGGLSVTVQIVGARRGQQQTENLTCTCTDGNATTATATKYYDEVTSITPVDITSAASGDALTCGIDGTSFGLRWPIRNLADVISIINVSTNTEQAPTSISTTNVDAANSAIIGQTLATTDRWEIQYVSSVGGGGDGFGQTGVFS